MNAGKIRGWLLQLPKPHTVRVSGDGEPQELKPGRSYAKLAETITALGVDLLEALDKDGKIIRALRLDDEDGRRSDAAAIPSALTTDPETARLTHFANLLHRAYEHSTEIAFTRLVDVVERMNDRAETIEQRLERAEAQNRQLLREQVEDAFERAREVAEQAQQDGNGAELGQQMLGAFLGAKMNAKGAPNGKGHG